jgi:hypothetical protein
LELYVKKKRRLPAAQSIIKGKRPPNSFILSFARIAAGFSQSAQQIHRNFGGSSFSVVALLCPKSAADRIPLSSNFGIGFPLHQPKIPIPRDGGGNSSSPAHSFAFANWSSFLIICQPPMEFATIDKYFESTNILK